MGSFVGHAYYDKKYIENNYDNSYSVGKGSDITVGWFNKRGNQLKDMKSIDWKEEWNDKLEGFDNHFVHLSVAGEHPRVKHWFSK